ncbi:hypothetical protein [Laceyella putida]|uniref:Uncharacterized protein n=1 Tax=Laceyella putida TaxID=110101 RepID=A0ABW2RR38_9BACL
MHRKIHLLIKLIDELGVQVTAGPRIDITPAIKELVIKYPEEMQEIIDYLGRKKLRQTAGV